MCSHTLSLSLMRLRKSDREVDNFKCSILTCILLGMILCLICLLTMTPMERVDVEDGSGVSVVILEGHALVDGAIDHNVDDVSVLEGGEGFGDVDRPVLFESFSELMPSFASIAIGVSHLFW